MKKYKDIETLAKELEIPDLKNVSSKGFTTEDIVVMKYKDLEPFGLSPEQFGKLKKYLDKISMENPESIYEENQIHNQIRVANYPVQNQMTQPTQIAQPNMRTINTKGIPEKSWSNHLFGCFHDLPFCILASAMPCVAFGLIYSKRQPDRSCLCASQRGEIREKYNISGGGCEDVCIHCWCKPCAMTQEMLELRHHKE